MARHITAVTRRRLVEGFSDIRGLEQGFWHWSGTLDDESFLDRLYPLDAMPSDDPRFATAREDIIQHRSANPMDWPDDWIFGDPRLGLADGDEKMLTFLTAMLHPAVRTHLPEVQQLLRFLNGALVHDGYELVEVDTISGAPVFAWHRAGAGVAGEHQRPTARLHSRNGTRTWRPWPDSNRTPSEPALQAGSSTWNSPGPECPRWGSNP